jgi:hypothetical protein
VNQYLRLVCNGCDYFYTMTSKQLAEFMSWAPRCNQCGSSAWHVEERSVYDQEQDDGPVEFHPIPYTEKAIKKEFSSCMGELHLYLMSDEGQLAAQRAKFDPRGPWTS